MKMIQREDHITCTPGKTCKFKMPFKMSNKGWEILGQNQNWEIMAICLAGLKCSVILLTYSRAVQAFITEGQIQKNMGHSEAQEYCFTASVLKLSYYVQVRTLFDNALSWPAGHSLDIPDLKRKGCWKETQAVTGALTRVRGLFLHWDMNGGQNDTEPEQDKTRTLLFFYIRNCS